MKSGIAIKSLLLYLLVCPSFHGLANNILVSGISLTARNTSTKTVRVNFDLSWDNSWRTTSAPFNWDAAWVFVKYKIGATGEWKHATLATTGHTIPSGAASTQNDATGIFVYRSAAGSPGTFIANGIQLQWTYGIDGVSDEAKIFVRVFAIEMVYHPPGGFQAGSGGHTTGEFRRANDVLASGTATTFTITGSAPTVQGNNSSSSPNNIAARFDGSNDISGITTATLAAGYPTGFNSFYAMKYEISQQQYVDFLNTLTYTQQAARTATLPNSSAGTGALVSNNANRNGIDIQTSGINASQPAVYACNLDGDVNYNEADDGQHIACNYLSWDDLDAYLDWAALRPMSELEFEKSCRGNLTPNAGEYPWGTATAVKPTGLTNGGNASEVASNSTANMAFDITSIGPLRTGIFATGSTNRNGSGAGYYGNMDLGGNLWERVVTLGKDEGRTFSGNHGNGTLTTQGYADVTGWPVAAGTGWRGGAYNLPDSTALAARRTVASNGDNNRSANAGGRGARTDPAGIVTDGLVLWLDAGITSSYPTSGTSWTDLSGNRNNGTLTNGPTFNSANGGSIVFDGVNDYVSNTMPNPGSVPITFDFWLNSNTSTPIGLFDTAPSSMNVLRNYGAGNIEWWNSDPTVSLGVSALTWTNITIEYSFTTNRTMKYYRNGNLITTATGSASSSFAWTSLIFGNINGGNDGWYSGKISTIKIYNRALSAAEVLQNFNALKTRFGL